MRNRSFITLVALFSAIAPQLAEAVQYDRYGTFIITNIGVQAGAHIYLSDMSQFPLCASNVLYLSFGTESDKSRALAMAMTAYMAGKPLNRIAYEQSAAGQPCLVNLFRM